MRTRGSGSRVQSATLRTVHGISDAWDSVDRCRQLPDRGLGSASIAPCGNGWRAGAVRILDLRASDPDSAGVQHDIHKPEDLDSEGEDHCADALRYGVMGRPQAAAAPVPKNLVDTWARAFAAQDEIGSSWKTM